MNGCHSPAPEAWTAYLRATLRQAQADRPSFVISASLFAGF